MFLEASDWPRKHLNHGTYVWSPPPASAPAALEWLGESKHKRPTLVHVVVVPRLLTALWRKQLGGGGVTDVMLTVPLGCPAWQADKLEPLILAISLTLSHSLPWRFRNTPATQDVEQRVPQMWSSSFGDIGSMRGVFPVCEGVWCAECYDVDSEDDVFPIKRLISPEDEHAVVDDKDTERFMVARNGDHFMFMFQCDLCHFRNI